MTADVGSAGGTLSISNGARLDIPAGALGETQEVIFSVVEQTQAFNNRDFEKPVGPTLLLQPSAQLADGEVVTVSIPAPPIPEGFAAEHLTVGIETVADEQRAGVMGSTQTQWTYAPAAMASNRVSADLPSITGLRVQFLVSRSE